MGLIAMLAAFVAGAVFAMAFSVLSFMLALTAAFVTGSVVALTFGASITGALGNALMLSASAQVGYTIGLVGRAWSSGYGASSRAPSGWRSRFRTRK